MPKHKSFYVFKVSTTARTDKVIVEGLNEKEARRNIQTDLRYLEYPCPKIEFLSVHGTYWDALHWRTNDNEKNSC